MNPKLLKRYLLTALLALSVLATSCLKEDKPKVRIVTMTIAPEFTEGSLWTGTKYPAMNVKSTGNDWGWYAMYPGSIEGFEYAEGFEYRLRVLEIEDPDPPMDDALPARYILQKVLSKTKVE